MKNKDLKKRLYHVIVFENLNKTGRCFEYTDLHTAFYCFRDCINSGLYTNVILRVYSDYGFCADSAPVLYAYKDAVYSGMKEGIYNYYLTRFKAYINAHGTTKPINFINSVSAYFETI